MHGSMPSVRATGVATAGVAAAWTLPGLAPHAPPLARALGIARVRRRGWRPLLWSRWGADWRARTTPQEIAARATDDVEPGDVILLHDADTYSAPGSHRRTAAALPLILDALEARGLTPTVPGALI